MRPRSDTHGCVLEVRAYYSVPALARIGNVSTYTLRRVLRANDVVLVRARRALFVPLSEIQDRIPPLWKSICIIAELQAAGAQTHNLVRPVPVGARRKRSPQG